LFYKQQKCFTANNTQPLSSGRGVGERGQPGESSRSEAFNGQGCVDGLARWGAWSNSKMFRTGGAGRVSHTGGVDERSWG